ncbi:MAG: TlpA family protein disulfide reductase [Christensenellales bacterium]
MKISRLPALLLAALLALGTLSALGETTAEPAGNPFAAMTITDLQGEPFDVSIFQGKPFMLNIWASWCPPCVAEMPDLDLLSKVYADRLTIVGLLGDAASLQPDGSVMIDQGELDGASAFYRQAGISYPSLIPNALMLGLMYQIQMQYFPTTLFFDGEGGLVDMQVGGRAKEEWIQVIDEVLSRLEAQAGA